MAEATGEVLEESGNRNVDETSQVVEELVHEDAPDGSVTPEGADAHSVGRGKGRGLIDASGVAPEDADSEDSSELTGDALNKRAAELEIEGRSEMSADEKREAIAKAESK